MSPIPMMRCAMRLASKTSRSSVFSPQPASFIGTPVLARYGVSVAAWLLWCVIAIDAYTDFPRVNAIMQVNHAWFITSAGGWWGEILFWLARAALLFMATVGLELFFVVLAICALALLIKGFSTGRRVAAAQGGV